MNPQGLDGFFERMRRKVGFQRFYSSLYYAMRLLYQRMFDERLAKIEVNNSVLNQAVSSSLAEESSMLKRIELQVSIRKKRVEWLTGLSSNWEFEERTKWKEDINKMPQTRTG